MLRVDEGALSTGQGSLHPRHPFRG
jgi:hypothetical protein